MFNNRFSTNVLIMSIGILVAVGQAPAATIYVDAAATGANDGTSWDDAFTELRDAISAAKNLTGTNEIWVAAIPGGLGYAPAPAGGDRSASFELVSGLAIYGGFSGEETSRDQRIPMMNMTILSGDLNKNDPPASFTNNDENSYHVVTAIGTDATAVLDGFFIIGGNANGAQDSEKCGGGFYSTTSGYTLDNCYLIWNSAEMDGGGACNTSTTSATISNCVLSQNKARIGGGMFNNSCVDLSITSSMFVQNSADTTIGAGGGMYSTLDCFMTVTNCLFSGNQARSAGGSFNAVQRIDFVNCTFSNNKAVHPTIGFGGGMMCGGSNTTTTNCIFWGNTDKNGSIETSQITKLAPLDINYSCVQGWTGTLGGTGNIGDDPLFVDPTSIIYRLQPGSPCIDVGDNEADLDSSTPAVIDPLPNTDLNNNPRFLDDPLTTDGGNGTAPIVDMGVYEYFLDPDGDYIESSVDNCPDAYNFYQIDSDLDGTGDACDGCIIDPNKSEPGTCGCGTPDDDSDGDGTLDCNDNCKNDPNKTEPGACGCGLADADSDGDGTLDCNDGCPNNKNKTQPDSCGCGDPEKDSDKDGTLDCNEDCPFDPDKTKAGDCGCGTPESDTDTDNDGTLDCNDKCPDDPNKTEPGTCGCGTPDDTNSDGDSLVDCLDFCPNDSNKTEPGACGCGFPDADNDGDGTLNCYDPCPNDPDKIAPGLCGCGITETPGCLPLQPAGQQTQDTGNDQTSDDTAGEDGEEQPTTPLWCAPGMSQAMVTIAFGLMLMQRRRRWL